MGAYAEIVCMFTCDTSVQYAACWTVFSSPRGGDLERLNSILITLVRMTLQSLLFRYALQIHNKSSYKTCGILLMISTQIFISESSPDPSRISKAPFGGDTIVAIPSNLEVKPYKSPPNTSQLLDSSLRFFTQFCFLTGAFGLGFSHCGPSSSVLAYINSVLIVNFMPWSTSSPACIRNRCWNIKMLPIFGATSRRRLKSIPQKVVAPPSNG